MLEINKMKEITKALEGSGTNKTENDGSAKQEMKGTITTEEHEPFMNEEKGKQIVIRKDIDVDGDVMNDQVMIDEKEGNQAHNSPSPQVWTLMGSATQF